MVRSLPGSLWCMAVLLIAIGPARAATTSLYTVDGSLPGTQGSLLFLGLGGGSQSAVAEGVAFDSTLAGDIGQIGYTGTPVVLDRSTGFTLTFDLRIDSESHSGSNHRAGFSVVAVASDLLGIEIDFWEDEIWVQNDDFTKGEGTVGIFDTTSALGRYSLEIRGAGYTLSDGSGALFSGALRDYPVCALCPYEVPNYLFFGDNTSSARSTATLGAISVTTAPVPLPAGFGLMFPALLGLIAQRRGGRGDQPAIT